MVYLATVMMHFNWGKLYESETQFLQHFGCLFLTSPRIKYSIDRLSDKLVFMNIFSMYVSSSRIINMKLKNHIFFKRITGMSFWWNIYERSTVCIATYHSNTFLVPQCGLFNSFFFLVSKLAKPDESLDICSNKNKIRVISHKIWKIAFDNPILPICYYEDSIGCKTRASHGLHQTLCLIYWYTSWKKISFNPAAKEYDIYKQSYQKCQAF